MTERITSRGNSRIKQICKLQQSAKYRREMGLFVAEGARLCRDAAQSGVLIEQFFYTAAALQKYNEYGEQIALQARRCYEVSEDLFLKISDTKSPQGMLCLCRLLDKTTSVDKMDSKGRFVGLEDIQDPSNLGTILRTAEALGVDGVLLSAGCCDLYSPKVLRGSMGAVFRLPCIEVDKLPKVITELKKRSVAAYAAVPDACALPVTKAPLSKGALLLIGNEGNGLSKETIHAAEHTITIPMLGRAESLNASTAASILMWEMMR